MDSRKERMDVFVQGREGLNDPQAVALHETGRVLLMYERYPYGYHSDRIASWYRPEGLQSVSPGYEGETVCRSYVMQSDDGGESWSPLQDDPALIEPQCMGSILRFGDPLDGEPSIILVSHPASLEDRVNGVVRTSLDEGRTWASTETVCQGRFGLIDGELH